MSLSTYDCITETNVVFLGGNVFSTALPIPPGVQLLDVLRSGRDRIMKGWVKGKLMVTGGDDKPIGYCAIGAVDCYVEAMNALERELPPYVMQGGVDAGATVAAFNDSRSTTFQDILALFDGAIAKLEAEAFMTRLKSSLETKLLTKENINVCV